MGEGVCAPRHDVPHVGDHGYRQRVIQFVDTHVGVEDPQVLTSHGVIGCNVG